MIKRGAQARLEDIASGFEEKKNSVDVSSFALSAS
jgi:hypothetical protein